MLLRICLAASFVLLLCVSVLSGGEVRKYRFTGNIPAYRYSCGECSGQPYTTRAQIEGTFEVELDHELGMGTLLSLDAHLTNFEGLFDDGLWLPFGLDHEFLGPGRRYDRYRPPFDGVYEPAEYRPLGPDSWTHEHTQPFIGVPLSEIPDPLVNWLFNGVGFEPAPADSWMLKFDGRLPNPDGFSTSIVASYNIYFEGNEALFSYNIPVIDLVESIASARAVLVPEPGTISMTCFALGWWLIHHRRHRQR